MNVKKKAVIINGKGWIASLGKFHFFILLPFVLLTGCMTDMVKNDFDEETVNQAKETAESFLRNNYENIQTIEFSEDYSNPMGGLMIRGTVNEQEDANFLIDIDFGSENKLQVSSIGKGKDFPVEKEECKDKFCDY